MKLRILMTLLPAVIFLSGCSVSGGKFRLHYDGAYWADFSVFGVLFFLAFLMANFVLQKEFHRKKLDPLISDTLVVITLIAGIAGARLFYALEMKSSWTAGAGFWYFFLHKGGLTFYGGAAAAFVLGFLYLWKKGAHPWEVFDLAVPAVSLAYGIGRIGCFLSGDGCYGIRCAEAWPAPLCMAFPDGVYPWQKIVELYNDPGVRVFNTPLMESMYAFLLFSLFWGIRRANLPIGMRTVLFTILYSVMRFFIEFIRRNPSDVFGWTQAQFISIILLTVSLSFLILYILKSWILSKN